MLHHLSLRDCTYALTIDKHFIPCIICPSSVRLPSLLNLANNFAGPGQALNHLLALLAPADRVVGLLQQVVHVLLSVELLEELGLHGVFGESVEHVLACILALGVLTKLTEQD